MSQCVTSVAARGTEILRIGWILLPEPVHETAAKHRSFTFQSLWLKMGQSSTRLTPLGLINRGLTVLTRASSGLKHLGGR